MAMHDPSSDLMECLDWKHNHPTRESRRQHALEIIRSGGDIHSVDEYRETCLHIAIQQTRLFDVVQLLLEKGIDANAQGWKGNTGLHLVCRIDVQEQTELVPMLLYHGADPWIRNNDNETPLDWILTYRFGWFDRRSDVEKRNLEATIEHLCYYMFDQYTEFGLSVDALLKLASLDLPIFHEVIGNIKKVDLDNFATTGDVDIDRILTMPSENLRLLLDKFDYVFLALFHPRSRKSHFSCFSEVRHENVYILVGSYLQREFIDWLRRWESNYRFIDCLLRYPASREEIVYYLLSCGLEIDGSYIIEIVYKYCGYNDLFKFLRFLDCVPNRYRLKQNIIPRLVFELTGNIQKQIEDPQFWFKHITDHRSELDFEPVLPYYVVPNLKDLCFEVKMMGKENFLKKLLDQPRIPLLVEMARNVFRKYLVQRLGITSAKQFYQSLELLQISPHHRKIIALETELY